jgi:hypothetical protein
MHASREIVHTVTDYYDGPRGGIADYLGKPHLYSSLWDEAAGDWNDSFLLQPVDDETFRLAMEDWAIWCRWKRAFHSGETTLATHPALPDDRARHDELDAILKPRLQVDETQAIRVRGIFEPRTPVQPETTSITELVVVWSSHENTA